MENNTNRTKEIVIGIICLLIFASVYYYVLHTFDHENDVRESLLKDEQDDKDYILVAVQIASVDPVKGDVQARVNLVPHGKYTEDGTTLTQDMTFYVNSITGKNEHNFTKGKSMNPIDVTLDMYDGAVTDYPFDTHEADLNMLLVTKEPGDSGKTKETVVPVEEEISFKAAIHGFVIEETKAKTKDSDYSEVNIHIERTSSVLYFSIFIMILMWAIIIAVVLILLSILVRKRKLEYSMFAFLATLLFALPALRGIQPFVPGIGCFSDYIAFFWAEGIVAAGLITMIFTWLKRPGAKM